MKLSDLSKFINILFLCLFFPHLYAEDTIDIWKKKNNTNQKTEIESQTDESSPSPFIIKENSNLSGSIIEEQNFDIKDDKVLYGIWDPDTYNFELSMWSNTDGQSIQKTNSRINKLKLSKTAENIFPRKIISLKKIFSEVP